jgi:hypothetical protein
LLARVAHHFIVQPFAAQIMHQTRCAITAGLAAQDRLDHALHADEAPLLQLVEHGIQIIALLHMGGQLALQLQPRMLALRQQLEGAALE